MIRGAPARQRHPLQVLLAELLTSPGKVAHHVHKARPRPLVRHRRTDPVATPAPVAAGLGNTPGLAAHIPAIPGLCGFPPRHKPDLESAEVSVVTFPTVATTQVRIP
jgi:hypothetical protein